MLTALKSGSLNLLEPTAHVQACNGIALPLPLHFTSLELKPDLHLSANNACNGIALPLLAWN